ncbi:hypothetical protein LCGC14_0934960 [marine sediment metagenome]|uniref:HD-CE domain-containing protein n=1 Tax=marine sediment metagenome TaxID=412755 RepID=A0A0F9NLV0_9ZZZZ|nr:hypothetical protein [bacterium]
MPLSTHSNDLTETKLYLMLKDAKFICQRSELNESLSKILLKYYKKSVKLMGEVKTIFKEYTLHDKTHILNVIDIMGRIIPDKTLEKLNCLEIFFLILSACFHDIGMYIEEQEITELKSSKDFQKSLYDFAHNKSKLSKLRKEIKEIGLDDNKKTEKNNDINLLEEIHLVNFMRGSHGERGVTFLTQNYLQKEDLKIDEVSIIPTLSKICQSHTKSLNDIDLDHHELISTIRVNSIYLGIILRLADILDFDRTRSPPELLDSIQSTRSLEEWNKHISVLGQNISQDNIIFHCECEKPKYQHIIYEFIQIIEQEIVQCKEKCNNFPQDFAYYKLNLPLRIDRSKIKPKDDKYIYRELFIQLNKEQVINLFMGLHTYNHPSLCIRELGQNAIDALTLRRALYQYYDDDEPKLEINFKHVLEEDGTEIVICRDTGIGMSLDEINQFLLVSGNSYYKSYDYKRWKTKFNNKKINCEIIAKFGIGFFSCFMIGDYIKVSTRKDFGPSKGYGEPYVIQIDGSQEIITVSKGDADQKVGTRIEISKREKEIYHHPNWDRIKLEETLNEYFVITEFPINIEVTVPNMEVHKTLEPKFCNFHTLVEETFKRIKTYTFDYKKMHSNLEGEIRTTFLIDEKGIITLRNDEAKIEIEKGSYKMGELRQHDSSFRTCFNGIVVYGAFGRERSQHQRGGSNLFSYPFSSATLNVIGDLQGSLDLNRTGYHRSDYDPKWRRLRNLAFNAYHKMWETIIENEEIKEPEKLWILFIIYKVNPLYFSADTIKSLKFPFIKKGDIKWLKLEEITEFNLCIDKDNWTYRIENDYILKPTLNIEEWQLERDIHINLPEIITKFIKIDFNLEEQLIKVKLNLETPPTIEYSPDHGYFFFVPFNKESILTLEWIKYPPNRFLGVFNSNHPISEIVASINYKPFEKLSKKEKFCSFILSLLDDYSFYKYYINKEEPSNFMKYIGHLYIHLNEIGEDLSVIIPFEIFLNDIGIIEINDDLLRSWQ